jgi:hypothetical protein
MESCLPKEGMCGSDSYEQDHKAFRQLHWELEMRFYSAKVVDKVFLIRRVDMLMDGICIGRL